LTLSPPWLGLIGGAIAIPAAMALLWLRQRRTGNAGIVDAGWTAAVGGLIVTHALTGSGEATRRSRASAPTRATPA
jgi:steroid 5-alpha reductase family enzyme